jgi:aspartyl aminopeptidase
MKELKEQLFSTAKNGYDRVNEADLAGMEDYCATYRAFLDEGKTERECTVRSAAMAEAKGFVPYERGMALHAGDKVYRINRGKSIMLAVIGQESLRGGANIVASHIDSPRLDLKPNPLYEEAEMAYFKTHYYGGIRKYQWVTIPLEMHGVVALKNGETVRVVLGEGDEPKYVITDLLPHLGAEQGKKPLSEAIPGENLNVLLGSRPLGGEDDKDRFKLQIMKLLHDKYGIVEDDFISAELEVVPAAKATDIGLDGSLIGAYGHDDRVCAYAALAALLEVERPKKTAVCMLADKEEIGSMGVTGMQSAAFDTFMEDLCQAQDVALRECYEKSFCLSSDVTAAYDPGFADVYEKRNSARVNYGIGLCKYTGARGKGGSSDADAETVAYVRRVLDEANVVWQMSELGKVDAGGGGTVAQYMANRNITTLDAGVPVLSMHSPFEVVGKLDCFMTYKGCKAVYEA